MVVHVHERERLQMKIMTCAHCVLYFDQLKRRCTRVTHNGECDCPKCQSMCSCLISYIAVIKSDDVRHPEPRYEQFWAEDESHAREQAEDDLMVNEYIDGVFIEEDRS